MRLVVAPAPTLPVPKLTPVVNGQTEIDLTANYVGIPFAVAFLIESAAASSGPFGQIASVPPNSNGNAAVYDDTSLSAGQTRYYRARMQLKGGGTIRYTPYSAVVSGTTQVPPPPPPPPSGQVLKQFFGHYENKGYVHTMADVAGFISFMQGLPSYVTGVYLRLTPYAYDQGTSSADYSGSDGNSLGYPGIKTILDACLAAGKKCWVCFEDRTFGGQITSQAQLTQRYPTWYLNNGWVNWNFNDNGNLNAIVTNWVPATNAAWNAALVDFLSRFDSHQALTAVTIGGESAIDPLGYGSNSANYLQYISNIINITIPAVANQTQQTPFRWQFNNVSVSPSGLTGIQYAAQCYAQIAQYGPAGMIMGGPDPDSDATPSTITPTSPPTYFLQGWQTMVGYDSSNNTIGPNYSSATAYGVQPPQNSMAFCAEFQGNGAQVSGATPANMIATWMKVVRPQYCVWSTVYSGTNQANFTQSLIQSAIQSAENAGVGHNPNAPPSWNVVPPSAPTALTVDMQGQTVPLANSGNAPIPATPSSYTLYFTQGAAASGKTVSGNVVYRSKTSATSGFSPIINTSAFAINGLAANTGTITPIGSVLEFTDANASGCVGSTAGSETQPPTVRYAATTYWYRVTTVDSTGLESAQSATQQTILYQNGRVSPQMQAYLTAHGNDPNGVYTYSHGLGGDFNTGGSNNVVATYNSTTAPNGWPMAIKLAFNASSFGDWLPWVGGALSQWNLWAGAHSSLQYDICPTVALSAGDLTHQDIMAGDVFLTPSGGPANAGVVNNLPACPINVATTVSWALSIISRDFGASPFTNAVTQLARYKFGMQISGHSGTVVVYVNNIILPGTP